MGIFITLTVIIGIILLLAALYLFVLVRPKVRMPHDERLVTDYAHRGLHDDALPENSLAAFEAAAKRGCGIELDVQLSRDGEVMVFHDYELSRMTGRKGLLSGLDAAELETLRLGGSDERIPRLTDVLRLIAGRVPLLIELKGENLNSSLCPKVAQILKKYKGLYRIESFNPILLGKMAKLLPSAYRGILYTNVVRDKRNWSPVHMALASMATNIIARPNFVAFNEKYRDLLAVKITTKLFRAKRFVWTVRSREGYDIAKANGECAIFEGIKAIPCDTEVTGAS